MDWQGAWHVQRLDKRKKFQNIQIRGLTPLYVSEFPVLGGIQVKADIQREGSGRSHRCSEDLEVVGGQSCPGWEGLRGASGGASVVATGKEPCRGGGGLRVRAQLRSAAHQVHSWQGPSQWEVGRGRFLGVSTPRGGEVSRKHRG